MNFIFNSNNKSIILYTIVQKNYWILKLPWRQNNIFATNIYNVNYFRIKIQQGVKVERGDISYSEESLDKNLDVFISYRRSNGAQLASLLKVNINKDYLVLILNSEEYLKLLCCLKCNVSNEISNLTKINKKYVS